MRPDPDQVPPLDRTAALELSFIAAFLEARGHTLHTVNLLPDAERIALMRAASFHASMRMTEVESRAYYVDALHLK